MITILSSAAGLQAATAILDCIGDGYGARGGRRWRGSDRVLPLDASDKVVAFQFRSTSLKGWRASGAKLLVHLERGRLDHAPVMAAYSATFNESSLKGGDLHRTDVPVSVRVAETGAGWWEIALPASLAQRFVDHPNGAVILTILGVNGGSAGFGFLHARESLQFAPKLMVEGSAKLFP